MPDNASPYEGVSLHFLDDEAVLFDRDRQRLFGANAGAAIIWSCLQDRLTPNQTVDILIEQCGLDRLTAMRNVNEVIAQWHQWSERADDGPSASSAAFVGDRPSGQAVGEQANIRTSFYRLLDSVIAVRYETPILRRLADRLFGHLRMNESGTTPSKIFDVISHRRGFAVAEGGQIREWCPVRAGLPVMIKICLIRCALEESRDFCAVHAGIVRRECKCILLPGQSGAGKSTLVAGLAARGYEIWGDDTAVLTKRSFSARPVSCGIGLKAGSWPVLGPRYFPGLQSAHIYVRPDAKRVRYLVPPDYAAPKADETIAVSAIVFPHFEHGIQAILSPLRKPEALRRLLPGFVRLGGQLDTSDIADFVRWFGTIPCYDLRLSSLEVGLDLINGIP